MIKAIAESISNIDILLASKGKDAVCISIIIPLHKPLPGKKENRLLLEKAVTAVREQLVERYNEQITTPLLISLDELAELADAGIHAEGIGLFVSEHVKQIIPFFRPVKERIIISDSFEIRDLLYQNYYSDPYIVLHLTEKETRLFKGIFGALTEVNSGKFPFKYIDDYEYSRPSQGSSYIGAAFIKDFEQDKSRLIKIRYEHFLKNVDKALDPYLKANEKLIVCGVESDITYFKRNTHHEKSIIGQLVGNYTYSTLHKLAITAWDEVQHFYDLQKSKLISEFQELLGTKKAVTGLADIWKATAEGRAYQLLVEKDFSQPGFLVDNDNHLYLKPPMKPHRVISDAVNNLMQMVVDKGGEVIIVENGLLDSYKHIALVARY